MALGAGKGLTRHASGFGMEWMRENGPGAGSGCVYWLAAGKARWKFRSRVDEGGA